LRPQLNTLKGFCSAEFNGVKIEGLSEREKEEIRSQIKEKYNPSTILQRRINLPDLRGKLGQNSRAND